MKDDIELAIRQEREMQAFRREQLQRDGKIYDAILRVWITVDGKVKRL
jgi:hypothetical protein